MPRMGLGCQGRNIPFKKEKIKLLVEKILSKGKKIFKKDKIIIVVDGRKVGFLRINVPLNELEIGSMWKSPMGIKVELQWRESFAGALILRDMDEIKRIVEI